MWKYSCGACYIIYDPLVLPMRWPRVNNIQACVCFTICYFHPEGKAKKKKGNFLSYVVFSRSILTSCIGCSMPLHYALKIKIVGRERKPCAINSVDWPYPFFPCHKITESATAAERVIIVIAVLRCRDVRVGRQKSFRIEREK